MTPQDCARRQRRRSSTPARCATTASRSSWARERSCALCARPRHLMTTQTGRSYDRIDGRAKVTGGARYSAEVRLEGLLHAVLATSTIAAGRIARIDVRRAECAPSGRGLYPRDDAAPCSPAGLRLRQADQHDLLVSAGR